MQNKIKFVHQHESIDCGPACLTMVSNFHGLHYTLSEVKKKCAITRMGVSVQDIVKGGKALGLETVPLRLSIEQLQEIPLPAILFWKQDHFLVLYKIKQKADNTSYYVADPAYGKAILETDMIEREWTGNSDKGVVIVMQQSTPPAVYRKEDRPVVANEHPVLQLVKQFFKKRKISYVTSLTLLIFAFLATCAIPFVFRRVIDDGIGSKSFHLVWILLLAQFSFFIGSFVSSTISNWILSKTNFSLSVLLKRSFLRKLLRLPINYFDTRLNTDTLQRMGDQVKIQHFLTWKGLELVISVLSIVTFSVILFIHNSLIFVINFAFSALAIIWVTYFLRKRKALEYAMFLRQSESSNYNYEFIMHMPEIKVNGAQSKLIDKLIEIQEKQNKIELKTINLNIWQVSGVNFFIRLKDILAIALCAYFIIEGKMTIGYLMSITYILGQLTAPTQSFIYFLRDAQDAQIANRRINDVYNEENENTKSKLPLPSVMKDIDVQNISFKYPGSFNPFVINDLSIHIPENKVTAIIGQSGSGKTTLLKLLLSYYQPNAGRIMLSDYNLADIDTDQWRDQCGVVMQDGHIFNGTIADNIAFADKEPDMSLVEHAAKVACLHEFISTLPMGYNTKAGNAGIQLSGGQKQRLLIARAVYKNPKYIFFDEATSSLDANNEKQIMENLNSFFVGKTVIVIAHRLSTVRNADQIIVMENGQVVETGSHDELTQVKGKYFGLVKNQLELGV